MKTSSNTTRRTVSLRWQKWLIIFAVGILLPLFGVRVRAQAATLNTLGVHSHVISTTMEKGDNDGDDDNGSDDNGSDDNGSDDNGSDDSNDDNGSGGRGSDDNGSDDSSDDSGSGGRGSDDNGSDDSNDDNGSGGRGSDDNGSSDDSNDDNGSGGRGSDDNGGDDSNDDDSNDSMLEQTGRVNLLPAAGRVGTWLVGGKSYVVNHNTEFSLAPGAQPITTGACVKVHMVPGTTNVAREIEIEAAHHCTATTPVLP